MSWSLYSKKTFTLQLQISFAAHSWKIYLPLLSRTSLLDPMRFGSSSHQLLSEHPTKLDRKHKPSPDDGLHSIRSDQLSSPVYGDCAFVRLLLTKI